MFNDVNDAVHKLQSLYLHYNIMRQTRYRRLSGHQMKNLHTFENI